MSDDRPLVICGAGAAGMAAAVAAARAGKTVFLIERSRRLGGTVTHVLIHTLGGLFDTSGNYLNDGLPRELAERLMAQDESVRLRRIGRAWTLSVCPTVYEATVNQWLAEEARIRVLTGVRLLEAEAADRRIRRLRLASSTGEAFDLAPAGVVDATGNAELGRLVKPTDDALVRPRAGAAAGGLIFRLTGVAPEALCFPRGLEAVRAVHEAAASGELPAGCAHAWLDRGVRPGEAYAKLLVPLPAEVPASLAAVLARAYAARDALARFLRRRPEFAHAEVTATGSLGVRDGGAIVGQYELTADDVRATAKFPDAACRCAWPIEYWDPDRGVSIEHLPEGTYYEIPHRSLKSRFIDNLWVAGKGLCADAKAQASARVVGTCLAMGEAVGLAAARVAG